MRLTDLEPQLQRIVEPGKRYAHVDTLAEAQGVMFLCPKCYAANDGAEGVHYVLCWFAGADVAPEETPGPGRWKPTGTGLPDLTLRPSVNLPGDGCRWHGFITDGEVTSC